MFSYDTVREGKQSYKLGHNSKKKKKKKKKKGGVFLSLGIEVNMLLLIIHKKTF